MCIFEQLACLMEAATSFNNSLGYSKTVACFISYRADYVSGMYVTELLVISFILEINLLLYMYMVRCAGELCLCIVMHA